MSRYIEAVGEFHEQFGHPINNVKDNVDLKTRQLRIKLLFEELKELSEASDVQSTFSELCQDTIDSVESVEEQSAQEVFDGNNVDKVEELDALCDIQYVLSGAILALGHHKNFDQAFEDVQDSNMSKLCSNMEEVEATQDKYANDGVKSHVEPRVDKFVVLRDGDNKVLKNVNYKAVDLKKYV